MSSVVLLVEDNPMTRKLVRFSLERIGCEVLEAIDGKSGLALAEERKPDLVLQDLCLPDIDGFALLPELRRRCGPDVPILAFTGFVSRADESRLSTAGFDGVVIKPIEPSKLVDIVRAHLPLPLLEPASTLTGRKLLIADDDPLQLKLMRFRLSRLGCEVIAAHDGAEALILAKREHPDAVVSDVMMPEVDGFALTMALRQDPATAHLPILLVTSMYVEPADQELARHAGADALLLRTPELREVIDALGPLLKRGPRSSQRDPAAPGNLEREHVARVNRVLARQVALNQGLTQRSALQAAEIAVLTSITQAIIKHQDLATALDDVLATCFDAGGVSAGVLFLVGENGDPLRARVLGGSDVWDAGRLETFFGHAEFLRELVGRGESVVLPDAAWPEESQEILERSRVRSALVLPLVYGTEPLGALFMASRSRELGDPDWKAFARGVADQITVAVALTRTIEARRASETQARDNESRASEARADLRAVLDAAPDSVVHVDRAGVIRFVNRVRRLGLGIDDVVGHHWLATVSPEQHALLESAMARVLEDGSLAVVELRSIGPTGAPAWYSSHIGPARRNGEIAGAVVIARDITEKKLTEAQLIAADRMVAVGTLAAGVAHEINNPLAAVLGNLDLALRRPGLGREQQEELQDAYEAAGRVRNVVRDLKIFSRAEDEKTGPVDVHKVLESTLRMASNEIRHRARLVRHYEPIPPAEANESRLGQVLLNLVVNAAQAMRVGGAKVNELRVSTRLDEQGRVVVEIADTGPGIAPDVIEQVFTPFFTTKGVGEGTGLGLTICQRIVTALGGELTVDSVLGQGATFRVHLPRAQTDLESDAPPPSVAAAVRRGRVLVVDDDPGIGAVLRRTLSAEHDVTVTSGVEPALARLRAGERFDVILCDLMMPEATGMDFHAELSTVAADQLARVIFMTGGAFAPGARAFLERVSNLRIDKPFSAAQIRALVNEQVR